MANLLKELNTTISASSTPFTIPFSHYPFFYSLNNKSSIADNETLYPIQKLFNDLKVDMYLAGHKHVY
jgi:hypothetical protein